MTINTRLLMPFCPWCHSDSKDVALIVPVFGFVCYNDWHRPHCRNCGGGKFSHGHEFGCQEYRPDCTRELEALFAHAAAAQKILRASRDTAAIRSSNLNTLMLMTAIGKS